MASKKDTWEVFRDKMKNKRKKAGPTGNNKVVSAYDLIWRKGELMVQRLSAEVSGKAQKYSRIGARKFVAYDDDVSISGIKAACAGHYTTFANQELICDVLSGDQGPSCL